MKDFKDAGIFHLLSPQAVGGFGLGVETYAQAVRRPARGCASTAWTAGHLIEHVWMLARWPREVQDEVFAKGPTPLAAATAPAGFAEKVPGGYEISGSWSFASGVMHSGWVLLAAQHGSARLQCLVPISDVELLDVWHTAGLRGTGSNDVRAVRLHWDEATRIVAAAFERQSSPMTDEVRALLRLSLALSGEASAEAVRLIMAGSGGSAHRLSHPPQRIQRDVNVLVNHPTLTLDPILEQAGRGLLGLGFTAAAF